MRTVGKKYIIKTLSLFSALATVITGIFIERISQQTQSALRGDELYIAEITSLYASTEELKNTFDRAIDLNSFEEESKRIYGQCQEIKTRLYGFELQAVNTARWFSHLSEYALTDMADSQKNEDYSNKINDITAILLKECSAKKPSGTLDELELFLEEKDEAYYKAKLNDIESQYNILENHSFTEMRHLSEYVKTLLNSPTVPKSFKGSYTYPKSIVYISANSYTDIFPKGKFLGRFGKHTDDMLQKSYYETPEEAAYNLLRLHAGYAGQCKMVNSTAGDDSVYYIFCPIIEENNLQIINYNEPIKIAVNRINNTLAAFDATDFLKKHSPNNQINAVLNDYSSPPVNDTLSLLEENTVLIKNTLYKEYKLKSGKNHIYYYLTSSQANGILKEEKKYFRHLGMT